MRTVIYTQCHSLLPFRMRAGPIVCWRTSGGRANDGEDVTQLIHDVHVAIRICAGANRDGDGGMKYAGHGDKCANRTSVRLARRTWSDPDVLVAAAHQLNYLPPLFRPFTSRSAACSRPPSHSKELVQLLLAESMFKVW